MPSTPKRRAVARKNISSGSQGTARKSVEATPRPNRIFELMKLRKWTYPELAAAVREYAESIGDEDRMQVHHVTLNKLATGEQTLTHDWMKTLAAVYAVSPEEIIAKPVTEGLRRIKVMGAMRAGAWAEAHQWPVDEQYEIMIPDDAAMRGVALYAGLLQGESMNRRYPNGAIIILSRIAQKPGEIVEGRRYHVRLTHADGLTEETIKTLTKDSEGRYWLKPESDHPEHQEWVSLDGKPGTTVELIGRVRGVYHRED